MRLNIQRNTFVWVVVEMFFSLSLEKRQSEMRMRNVYLSHESDGKAGQMRQTLVTVKSQFVSSNTNEDIGKLNEVLSVLNDTSLLTTTSPSWHQKVP